MSYLTVGNIIGKKIMCIANLSHMRDFVEESLCIDKFPVIGKQYTIRDNEMGKISLGEFIMKPGAFNKVRTFDLAAFEEPRLAMARFRCCNMPAYNTPEFWASVKSIYTSMAWIKMPNGIFIYPHEDRFFKDYASKIALLGSEVSMDQIQMISDQLLSKSEIKLLSIHINQKHPSVEILQRFAFLGKYKIYLQEFRDYGHAFGGVFNAVKMCGRCDCVVTVTDSLESLTIEEKAILRYIKRPYRRVYAFCKNENRLIKLI